MTAIPRLILLCAALLLGTAAAAAEAEPAGMVKTSQGSARIDRAGELRPAVPGAQVHVGERIRTGPDGYVGITLRDDTRLTAGPNSTLLITDFQFNPTSHEGNLLATLLKGTFSVVTGLIAKLSPASVTFKTPTMTLGVRGTEFVVEVSGADE